MKLFGTRRESSGEPGFLQSPGFRALLTFCSVLLVIAVCIEVYRRATNYGTRLVEARPVDARIVITNPPAWLHRDIVTQLLAQSYDFVQKDEATYNRARNVLDGALLNEIASLYTGVDIVTGTSVSRQAKGYNAWIKRITQVRRNIAKDQSSQIIEVIVQWRAAEAWVRFGDMLYLIDSDGVRLPGDYPLVDRARSKMMVITGIDLPLIAGTSAVPPPGAVWTAGKTGRIGEDLMAAMKLADTLQPQQYSHQIDAIDMTNFNGRRDPRLPWIVLNTVWQTAAGTPRVVQWGRPIGAEAFYECHSPAKLKALKDLYAKFQRIDANCDYVDIRDEVLRLPKLATQADLPIPPIRG